MLKKKSKKQKLKGILLIITLLIFVAIIIIKPDFFTNQIRKFKYQTEFLKLEKIEISLTDSLYNLMTQEKDSVLKVISKDNSYWGGNNNKKSYVGKYIEEGFKYKAKVKLVGHYQDHLNRSPFSIGIKIKNGNFRGMNHINLLNPLTRFLNVDIFANYFAEHFKIKTIKSYPINGLVNSHNSFYILEEGFSSKRLNNDSIGWVIQDKVNPNFLLESRVSQEIPLFFCETYNSSTKKIDFINLKKFAQHFAIADLFQSCHQMYKDNRHYFLDKHTNKIEPLGREFWFSSEKGYVLIINQIKNDEKNEFGELYHDLIKNPKFKQLYYNALKEICEPLLIKSIYNSHTNEIESLERLSWMDYAWFNSGLNRKRLLNNQDAIKSLLPNN
tara:strand:+ start:146 stop:1300 length:1155 start_codon:yes stop_codon:yes gene_type:complete